MASKGSPMVALRIPQELLTEIEATMKKRNVVAFGEPWSRTDFILVAIKEKLAHMARSRRPGRRRRAPAANAGGHSGGSSDA